MVLNLFFALVAALSATSAVGVVVSRRPLYAALSLVVNMLSLALLFVLLSGQFLAAAQVIVYAGAVMVLFVFVITLLNPTREESPVRDPPQILGAVLIGGGLVAAAGVAFVNSGVGKEFDSPDTMFGAAPLGSIQAVGSALYRDFTFPVEATALVLLVAAVGAVYLSRGK
jgi:NADH-quinone oxidoreductase subunit J